MIKAIIQFNPWLTVACISWFIAQSLKMIIHTIITRKIDFSRLVDTGGMPSSHTAFVGSLAAAVGLSEGFHSVTFAVTGCFSLVVIYDATNLRRSAGYHAQVLNEIVPQLLKGKYITQVVTYRKLRELLGHNPLEVLIGLILGLAIAIWCYYGSWIFAASV